MKAVARSCGGWHATTAVPIEQQFDSSLAFFFLPGQYCSVQYSLGKFLTAGLAAGPCSDAFAGPKHVPLGHQFLVHSQNLLFPAAWGLGGTPSCARMPFPLHRGTPQHGAESLQKVWVLHALRAKLTSPISTHTRARITSFSRRKLQKSPVCGWPWLSEQTCSGLVRKEKKSPPAHTAPLPAAPPRPALSARPPREPAPPQRDFPRAVCTAGQAASARSARPPNRRWREGVPTNGRSACWLGPTNREAVGG